MRPDFSNSPEPLKTSLNHQFDPDLQYPFFSITQQTRAAYTPKANRPMKIVFVSTEVAPWSKTGGLGDVVGSLPVELAKRGHKVMTVAPRYDQYKGAWDTSVRVDALGHNVGYFHEHKKGVDRVFVDHPLFLAKVWGKTGSKLYGKTNGADYADNQERFAMFCQAALMAPMVLPFGFGEDVCFVANDWHSGLVPVMIKKVFQPQGESPPSSKNFKNFKKTNWRFDPLVSNIRFGLNQGIRAAWPSFPPAWRVCHYFSV